MTQRGDIWILGTHRLMCGDSTERKDVGRLMDGARADMVFTDPPYGVAYTGGDGKDWDMIKGDDLQGDDLQKFLVAAFRNLVNYTEDYAPFYIWHGTSTRKEFEFAMTAAGLIEKQYLIWVKNNFNMGHQDYHNAYEPCFYAKKTGQVTQFYGDRTNTTAWRAALRTGTGTETTVKGGLVITDGSGGQLYITEKPPKSKKLRTVRLDENATVTLCNEQGNGTVWEIARDKDTYEHPTQKPTELATRALENSSKPGNIVLDLFGGSGTTLIASEQTQRRAYLMELDEQYCDVIVRRWEKFTGKKGERQ